jgi:hypothetical protein
VGFSHRAPLMIFFLGTIPKICAFSEKLWEGSNPHMEKNNLFEGVLYQFFEGIYYERDYKRNITITITILFVRGERERKKIKQTF